ncbi:MAG: hypothetical protein EXQ89_01735 [Rhodospirillaceae bacterium]|nr:hypothetical protein [Rhodospirillaceae bacterium]
MLPQITIRVAPIVKAAFDRYESDLGLRGSELAKLLIVRERRQRRLAKLSVAKRPAQQRSVLRGGERMPTITAHFSSAQAVAEFDAYASECGVNRNAAGLWLIEGELRERWLERAVTSQ